MVTQLKRLPVSKRAVIQRINRRLFSKGHKLKLYKCLEGFYIIDFEKGQLLEKGVDLEKFGRELDAIANWEYLVV